MNSSNNMGDIHLDGDRNNTGGISRSGRVRKKNSLLDVYDSTDIVEKRKRRGEKAQRGRPAKVARVRSHMKNNIYGEKSSHYGDINSPNLYRPTHPYSSNDLDMPFDGEVPDIAGEEIVEESPEEDDGRSMMSSSFHRLKSQAQSTYMMEKSFLKQRKITGDNTAGIRKKATRKDKGTSRITAYMLWTKSQVAHGRSVMDMRDLWATLPLNQKKMWKAKAQKIMKKKLNGTGNMKNSAGPGLLVGRKPTPVIPQPQRKGMKNTTPQEVYIPKRPPGRPPKKALYLQMPPPPPVPGPSAKFKPTQVKRKVPSPIKSSPIQTYPLEKQEKNQLKINGGTNALDVAARLSLLGEQMNKLAADFKSKKEMQTTDSLSLLLDSLLCSIPGLLSLTKHVPELNCIPESKLRNIINNTDYIMPGL